MLEASSRWTVGDWLSRLWRLTSAGSGLMMGNSKAKTPDEQQGEAAAQEGNRTSVPGNPKDPCHTQSPTSTLSALPFDGVST